MQVSKVRSWTGRCWQAHSPLELILFFLFVSYALLTLRSQSKVIPIGRCCVINTVCCDHLVIVLWSSLIGWLSSFHSPMLQMAHCVRPQRQPGYCNRWTPFWGCKGWCCRSAHFQWARRKTAPQWQLHLSAGGQEDAATAWITWEQWFMKFKHVYSSKYIQGIITNWPCKYRAILSRDYWPIGVFWVGPGYVVLQLHVGLLLKPLYLWGVVYAWVIWYRNNTCKQSDTSLCTLF